MSDHLDELQLRRLLVAVDGSDSSTLALRAAITVARRDNAALTLLCVSPEAGHDIGRFALAAGVPPTTQEELDAEAEKILRRTVELVPEDVPVRTIVRRGRPGRRRSSRTRARTTTTRSWSAPAASAGSPRSSAA